MLINEFRVLIEAAIDAGVLTDGVPEGGIRDHSLSRTVRWAGGLNGALLVSNAATVPTADPTGALLVPELFDGRVLALQLAEDMLLGWGAPPERLDAAKAFVDELRARDLLAVPGDAIWVADAEDATPAADGEPSGDGAGV
jgi:hypothetical protein